MADLILEVTTRHGIEYRPVGSEVLRVGRALDNDVILPDPAVSPYHFVIRPTSEGGHELVTLADENGLRCNGRRVEQPLPLDGLPAVLEAGRTRLRLLDRAQPVAPTRLLGCRRRGACVFGSWTWALALFTLMLLCSAYDNYLSTHAVIAWKSYWRDQVIITLAALSLVGGLVIVNRIASHRWDLPAALSYVSLVLGIAFLLDQLVPALDYLFTSPLPGFSLSMLWIVVCMPLATAWFLIRQQHGSRIVSLLFVVLLFTPLAYTQIKQVADYYGLLGDFSKEAFYSKALYPWDIRLQNSISLDDYTVVMEQAASDADTTD